MYRRVPTRLVSPTTTHEFVLECSITPSVKMHEFKFTVQGRGQFPFDMLRYDNCYPADPVSAGNMETAQLREASSTSFRDVTLLARHERKLWLPTFDRWKSFGWHVKSTVHDGE